MTRDAERTITGPEETSARAIYRMVCESDPVAIRNYLQTADPEDANHGILSYIDRLRNALARVEQICSCAEDAMPDLDQPVRTALRIQVKNTRLVIKDALEVGP
jgi:hypothetical protein